MSPDLSIIIPTYNRRDLLEETLDSFVGKLTCSYEVLIIDDGSEDDTRSYLETLEAPCRVFFQDHRGGSAARNVGLCAAHGKFIKFLDDDDLLVPEIVDQQVRFMVEHPDVDLCVTNWGQFSQQHRGGEWHSIRYFSPWHGQMSDPIAAILDPRWHAVFSYMYRAEVLVDFSWDESLSTLDDFDFSLRLAITGAQFDSLDLPQDKGIGWQRIIENEISVSRRDNPIKQAHIRTQIIGNAQRLLDESEQLTERRRQLIAEHYWDCASQVFAHDRKFYRELIARMTTVCPGFLPSRGPKLRYLIRLFGYERAHQLQRWTYRIRGYG